jgi:hypothetical protein
MTGAIVPGGATTPSRSVASGDGGMATSPSGRSRSGNGGDFDATACMGYLQESTSGERHSRPVSGCGMPMQHRGSCASAPVKRLTRWCAFLAVAVTQERGSMFLGRSAPAGASQAISSARSRRLVPRLRREEFLDARRGDGSGRWCKARRRSRSLSGHRNWRTRAAAPASPGVHRQEGLRGAA